VAGARKSTRADVHGSQEWKEMALPEIDYQTHNKVLTIQRATIDYQTHNN